MKLKMPKLPKKHLMGVTRSKPFRDTDKDLAPDVIDCEPRNPRKQGRVGDFLSKAGEKYKEYKAKEPERREAKLGKLQHKLDVQRTRQAITESKSKEQRSRLGVQRVRQRSLQPFGGTRPSLFQKAPPGFLGGVEEPTKKAPTKKRRKKRKRR